MTDIVERLRARLQVLEDAPGDTLDSALCLDLNEAADTIERLLSICGNADVGSSFAELTKNIPRPTAAG